MLAPLLRSLLFASLTLTGAAYAATPTPFDSVDPFIGTTGDGNVTPAATLPFGFIQVGPDTGPGSGAAGYKFDKNINGFSQQHISGMGGPVLGEISVFPFTGSLDNPSGIVSTGKSAETASPGFYSVTLAPWNVKTELTCTQHVALHHYQFPEGADAHVLVDVGHCLYGSEKTSWGSAKPVGGEVHVDASKQESVRFHGL